MIDNSKEVFISCESNYKESDIVIFGAPFDGTTSYRPGTRFGSKAIRSESYGIETYSPYQDKDLVDCNIYDAGDLELPFGNTLKVLKEIEDLTYEICSENKIPCMLGGEHLVTLGAFKGALKQYKDLCVIHFDAHTDLREDYLGEKLSHATVIKRIYDEVGDNRIYQFGIRSGEKYEFEFAKEHTNLTKFNFNGLTEAIRELKDKPVYFTIDLDVLDPSEFPGTGTPEAGGVRFMELLNAIIEVSKLNIVAFDIVELSPMYDQSGRSTAISCKLLREILLSLKKLM